MDSNEMISLLSQIMDEKIGMVTAYAYAKSKGYTGTEEEFAQLMADLADEVNEFQNFDVVVNTLPAGSSATATYSNGVLTLGVPQGARGDTGEPGATGPTGPQGPKGDKGDTGEVTQTEFDELSEEVSSLNAALGDAIEQFAVPTQEAVDNWLNAHPEATTTVEDGSLTEAKFTDALKLETVNAYVTPEMYGAKGDGVANDTQAVQSALTDAISKNRILYLNGVYNITGAITVNGEALYMLGNDATLKLNGYGITGSCKLLHVQGVNFVSIVSSATSAVAISQCDNATFNNVTVKSHGGFAIIVSGTGAGTARVINCKADTVYRDVFRLTKFYNVYALNNVFKNIGDDCLAFSTDAVNGCCEIAGNYVENGYGFNLLGRSNVIVMDNIFRYSRGFIKTGKSGNEGRTDCTNIVVTNNLVKAIHPNNGGREIQSYSNTSGLVIKNNIFTDDDLATAPSTCIVIGTLNSSPVWDKGFFNATFNTCTDVVVADNTFGITTGSAYGSTRKFAFDSCEKFELFRNKILRFTTQIVQAERANLTGSKIAENYIDSDPDRNLNTLPSVFVPALANQAYNNEFYHCGAIAYKYPQKIYFNYSDGTIAGAGSLDVRNENIQLDETNDTIVSIPLKSASTRPSSGYYVAGYFVHATAPSRPKLIGWRRLTSGDGHTLGTDWQEIEIA